MSGVQQILYKGHPELPVFRIAKVRGEQDFLPGSCFASLPNCSWSPAIRFIRQINF